MSGEWFGKWGYSSAASGTIDLLGTTGTAIPKNARLRTIIAEASAGGASVAINGGNSIPVPSGIGLALNFDDGNLTGATKGDGTLSIVFTGTALAYVDWVA